jgi:hypothetical protein
MKTADMPVRIGWPSHLAELFMSLKMEDEFGGIILNVNMLTSDSARITFSALTEIIIMDQVYLGLTSVRRDMQAFKPEYALTQNYPNPFNPTTTISFSLPHASHIILEIYNLLGQEVQRLIDEERPPGDYSVVWNPGNLASGVYFYRLQTGTTILTKKLVVMR